MRLDEKKGIDAIISLSSNNLETIIKQEHAKNQTTTPLNISLKTNTLAIPKISRIKAKKVEFKDTGNPVKSPIYLAIIAAFNYTMIYDSSAINAKESFARSIPDFVNWLNTKEIGNKYLLLKEYERDWFDSRNNHGSESPLKRLKTVLFYYSSEVSEFNQMLTPDEANFLKTLSKTKICLKTDKKQDSLATYFGAMSWLMDENIGVGANLYRVFASPKLAVNSLKALVSTVLLEFYESKVALRDFLISQPEIVKILDYCMKECKKVTCSSRMRKVLVGNSIYSFFVAFHELSHPPEKLKNAMSLVAVSSLTTLGMKNYEELTKSKTTLYDIFKSKKTGEGLNNDLSINCLSDYFSSQMANNNPMLSIPVLLNISAPDAPLPITEIERLMFSWLMASLAVQPYDINKLTKDDFRLMKIGQRATHIECEYFKGRANAIHRTRSLSVKKIEGKALLTYLNQHPSRELMAFDSQTPAIIAGGQSVLGNFFYAISIPFMNVALKISHEQQGAIPFLMPKAIQSLVKHGVNIYNTQGLAKNKLPESRTFCKNLIFTLRDIKNSAVHAFSDPYTLQYLINRNSHSNKTERTFYLTEENEQWINSSGRITRSVMLDLINNVFDLDFSSSTNDEAITLEVADFNFEFESVSQIISYKSEEMLARLQVVTEQHRGRINEVGVMAYSASPSAQYNTIYVLDSPVTVCKMKNYLFEFKKNYRKLLKINPDHFYQTVLPTVEWIEQVLSKKLSSKSIKEGTYLFENTQRAGVSINVFHSI